MWYVLICYVNYRNASATLLPFKRFLYTCVFTSPLFFDQSNRTENSPNCQFYKSPGFMLFLGGRVIIGCSDVYRSSVKLEDGFSFILRNVAFQDAALFPCIPNRLICSNCRPV